VALFLIKVAGGGASAADATSTDIKRVLMLFDASKNLPANLSMEEGRCEELKDGSSWQKACAGAPAPPRWNARSARVFNRGSGSEQDFGLPQFDFSQLQAVKAELPYNALAGTIRCLRVIL